MANTGEFVLGLLIFVTCASVLVSGATLLACYIYDKIKGR